MCRLAAHILLLCTYFYFPNMYFLFYFTEIIFGGRTGFHKIALLPNETYWYYKLHATQKIFPTRQPDKLSKYKHLGKPGSPAHINAVISVARRTQIDYLQSCIDSLRQNWADLYDNLKNQK